MDMGLEEKTTDSFHRLIAGVRKFRQEIYPRQKAVYEQAVQKQQAPHTLFITCADSRIDPEMITQSGPGDIFVTRNIGNMVPAYGEMLGGVSAVIEYAVSALKVSQIVICGHTDCGAMKALLQPESLEKLPTVKAWSRNAEAALSITHSKHPDQQGMALLNQLIRDNVVLQMMHLRTHPSVAGRVALGNLAVHGWVYDIGNGLIDMYDLGREEFLPLEEAAALYQE